MRHVLNMEYLNACRSFRYNFVAFFPNPLLNGASTRLTWEGKVKNCFTRPFRTEKKNCFTRPRRDQIRRRIVLPGLLETREEEEEEEEEEEDEEEEKEEDVVEVDNRHPPS